MKKIVINSKIGEVEIDPETVISFPKGILGFPKFTEYVLLNPDDNSPLKLLQSMERSDLAFIVTNPRIFKQDYQIKTYRKNLDDIGIKNPEDILDLVIVTIPTDPSRMTANLKGPLLINSLDKLGKQLVLDDKEYSIKYPLLKPIKKVANG